MRFRIVTILIRHHTQFNKHRIDKIHIGSFCCCCCWFFFQISTDRYVRFYIEFCRNSTRMAVFVPADGIACAKTCRLAVPAANPDFRYHIILVKTNFRLNMQKSNMGKISNMQHTTYECMSAS